MAGRALRLVQIVMAGLDPAIHLLRKDFFAKNDGPAGSQLGQARVAVPSTSFVSRSQQAQKLFKGGWSMTFDNSNSEELATKELCTAKMPLTSARANSTLFILLIAATLFPVSAGRLLGLLLADLFAGHVARVVMERPRLLFARLLLVRILVVAHGCSFECLRQRHRASLVPLCSRRHRLMPAGQSKGSPMGATWSRFPGMCAPIENRRLPIELVPCGRCVPARPYRHGCAPAPDQTPRNRETSRGCRRPQKPVTQMQRHPPTSCAHRTCASLPWPRRPRRSPKPL
jgi:hypothetical protein